MACGPGRGVPAGLGAGACAARSGRGDRGRQDVRRHAPARADAAGESDTDLAKKLQNPIGDLYSFPFQSNTNFGVGPHRGTQDILNIQPVIPIHVNADWNIITRTILPVVWNPDLSPSPSVPVGTGPTDFSAFLSPKNPTDGWLWGSGSDRPDPDRQRPRPRLQRLGRRSDGRDRLYERALGRRRRSSTTSGRSAERMGRSATATTIS